MSFKIPKGGQDHVFLEVVKSEYNQSTGKPLFKPYQHITTQRGFFQFLEHPGGLQIIKVNHMPDNIEVPKNFQRAKGITYHKEVEALLNGDIKPLNKQTLPELQETANKAELSTEGTKAELIERIEAAQ